jgi:hypothetical protein
MKTNVKDIKQKQGVVNADYFERLWEKSWSYIKTVVDVVREPVLVLDKDFRVLVANEPFYRTFHVEPADTESKIVYDLGDGQWNIPALKKLLEEILPKNTFFKGFEVIHDFPFIGHKVMVLNARQIHFTDENIDSEKFPPVILLAIEDITEMMVIAETLVGHTKQLENKLMERTQELESNIKNLQKEINELKKKPKKS